MKIKTFNVSCAVILLAVLAFPLQAQDEKGIIPDSYPLATLMMSTYSIDWLPKVSFEGMSLIVAGPDNFYWTQTFSKGTRPRFAISDIKGQCLDGQYKYELTALPQARPLARGENDFFLNPVLKPSETQSGSFRIQGGAFLSMTLSENAGKVLDVVYNDDMIIDGSLCVGNDCLPDNQENFGFDTIKLKENNLRILFDDTSTLSGYPANDWRITINDSTSGGANYFAIQDASASKDVFKIEAGAPSNSLYVDDYGRIGIKTSTPVVELHIKDSDSPTVRLEQDSSGGWTAQTWDMAGNESNFFIRDTTNGSKLPFRIQPGTPSSTLCLKSDGKVGIGTWSPEAQFEIEKTGENAAVIFQRTDGATGKFTARPSEVYMGSSSNHPVRFVANNVVVMTVTSSGYVGIGQTSPAHKLAVGTSGAYCDGAAWVDGSSRSFKSNIRELASKDAMAAVQKLTPVRYNYKQDKSEEYLGFIAEDVPEIVAMNDRQGLSPMDIVAVLTKVVQEQQKSLSAQEKAIVELKEEIAMLKRQSQK